MGRHSTYAAAALMAGMLITRVIAKDSDLLSLGADHFTQTASVTEEAHTTKISTERGYVERRGLMGEVWHDEFLTAVIDHDSGQVSYRMDVSFTYRGAPRSYQTAEYRGIEQLQTVPVRVLKRVAINCPTGECTYTEYLAVPLDEALLRHVAAGYAPGKSALWSFRIVPKRGVDYRGSISNAEMAGLLAKVDAYLQNPASAQAPPPPPPPPPARLDFGISGLTVSPTPEAPNRAGVLVVGVSPGSVAQRAGIITGDIIYEFEGRPIRSPGDLQGAVTATHSTAHIKLYRGTEVNTVEAHF